MNLSSWAGSCPPLFVCLGLEQGALLGSHELSASIFRHWHKTYRAFKVKDLKVPGILSHYDIYSLHRGPATGRRVHKRSLWMWLNTMFVVLPVLLPVFGATTAEESVKKLFQSLKFSYYCCHEPHTVWRHNMYFRALERAPRTYITIRFTQQERARETDRRRFSCKQTFKE